MTAYAAVQAAKSATLGIGVVDSVILTSFTNELRIMNRSATATDIMWATIGTTKNPPTDPTVAGDNCFAVPATPAGILVRWPVQSIGLDPANGAMVKLISGQAVPYTVQGVDTR